jgi:hypothetical protein
MQFIAIVDDLPARKLAEQKEADRRRPPAD